MPENNELQGKSAIVCASSRGLGLAIAKHFAREGALVTILSRSVDAINRAAEEIEAHTGHRPLAYACDVSNPAAIKQVVEQTVQQRGGLDILVNNAGGPPSGTFEQFTDEQWHQAHERNLLSVVRFVREALPHLKQSSAASIVNIVSISVKQPLPGLLLSNVYRAGVVGLAKTLADEFAPHGIRVNNVAPGRIATDRIKELDQLKADAQSRSIDEIESENLKQIPFGRYGTPDEFAEAVAFLASSRASYITGTTLQIDGGMVRSIQ